jgi:hypothetical protein
MSQEKLIEFLRVAAPKVRDALRQQPEPQHPDIEFPEEIRSQTEALLRTIPQLAGIDKKMFNLPNSGSSISFFRLAISTLERLSYGTAPKDILNDLVDIATRDRAKCFVLAGITGVSLENRIDFDEEISLLTASDLAPSTAKEFVFRVDRFKRHPGSPGHEPLPAHAALLISGEMQVLLEKGARQRVEHIFGTEAIRDVEQKMLFCLTASSEKAAPVVNAVTSWLDHPAQPYHGLTGASGGTSPSDLYSSRYDPFDSTLAIELFRKMDAVAKEDRSVLFLAADRLRRSRLHQDKANQAIDLGVALEIIFLHKIDGTAEKKYRLATNGACWLGGRAADRREKFEILSDAYDARSTAVHTGTLTKAKHVECLDSADKICREAAIKAVRDGALPKDWKAIMLSD